MNKIKMILAGIMLNVSSTDEWLWQKTAQPLEINSAVIVCQPSGYCAVNEIKF